MSQLVPKKIAVLLSGGGTNLQSLIDNIGDINAKIDIVISNRRAAFGLERAKLNNIDTLYLNQKDYDSVEAFNDEIINELEKRNIDLVVLAGYLKILSKRFIDIYKNRIMNVHPSLIPAFCGDGFYGLRVHEEAINYGVKVSGATVHFVTEDTDAGPIILQDTVQVENEDTAESLQQKVLKIEHKLLVKAVKLFCEEKLHIENRKVIVK